MNASQISGLGEMKARAGSPWCHEGRSGIHMRGLFASRAIPRLTRVVEYVGEKIPHAESQRRGRALLDRATRLGDATTFLFAVSGTEDIDGNFPWNVARLANHSCDPNCATDVIDGRIYIISIRNIKEGEELTYDYHFDLEGCEYYPCRCGAPDCAGYIVGEEFREQLGDHLRRKGSPVGL